MGVNVPISKNGFLDLVVAVADKVHKAQDKSDATTGQFPEKQGIIVDLELKVAF